MLDRERWNPEIERIVELEYRAHQEARRKLIDTVETVLWLAVIFGTVVGVAFWWLCGA